MMIRTTFPVPFTLTIICRDPHLTQHSPRLERTDGPEGSEIRLTIGTNSVYVTRGFLPR